MSNKLKISKDAAQKLNYLATRLNFKRNIVCRLAVGRSLAVKSSVSEFKPEDNNGFEFNRYTLTGDYDNIYKAFVTQHEGRKLSENDYFNKYFRRHVERGLGLLYDEYLKINSPIDFLVNLVDGEIKENKSIDVSKDNLKD
ncbi:MAG: DNA sulfur modification protein DndE [Promethearchaeota archaeon]